MYKYSNGHPATSVWKEEKKEGRKEGRKEGAKKSNSHKNHSPL